MPSIRGVKMVLIVRKKPILSQISIASLWYVFCRVYVVHVVVLLWDALCYRPISNCRNNEYNRCGKKVWSMNTKIPWLSRACHAFTACIFRHVFHDDACFGWEHPSWKKSEETWKILHVDDFDTRILFYRMCEVLTVSRMHMQSHNTHGRTNQHPTSFLLATNRPASIRRWHINFENYENKQ